MYKICIIPQGSTLPEDLRHKLIAENDFINRITAGADEEALIMISTRELQLLVEYSDLLAVEVRAVVGLQGAMYSTVWNTYVSTMERVSLDAYRLELQGVNDDKANAGRVSILNPTRVDRLSRVVPKKRELVANDDSDISQLPDEGVA